MKVTLVLELRPDVAPDVALFAALLEATSENRETIYYQIGPRLRVWDDMLSDVEEWLRENGGIGE